MKNIKATLFEPEIPEEMMQLFGGQKQAVDELLRRAEEGIPGPWIMSKGGVIIKTLKHIKYFKKLSKNLINFTNFSLKSVIMMTVGFLEKEKFTMSKKKMVDLVNRLKQSGIKVSLTKPKSYYHLSILGNHNCKIETYLK